MLFVMYKHLSATFFTNMIILYKCIFSIQTPRLEAITILGSLVCYPNHYKDTPVLHVDMEKSTIKTDVFKVRPSYSNM